MDNDTKFFMALVGCGAVVFIVLIICGALTEIYGCK